MKKNIKTLLCTFLICLTSSAFAITDEEVVQSLESLGDLETAYPFAYKLAQKQKTYTAWRDMAIKYAKFDTDEKAYLQAWQFAHTLNQKSIYQNFLKIKPQSPLNNQAIHAIFKLLKASSQIENYLSFLTEFPDVIESIDALLKIHEIAFQKAKEANESLIFDAFVITFPYAKQIPQAIKFAFDAEKHLLEEEFSSMDQEERENIARRLFNKARVAEKQNEPLIAARQYQLLHLEIFSETKIWTTLLDKEERLAYQKLMQAKQDEMLQNINEMRDALIETIQAQTQFIEQAVLEELRRSERDLDKIIAIHNRLLIQQFEQVNQHIEQVNKHKAQGKLEKMGADIPELISVKGANSKIAKIIGKISPIITEALKNPSKHQAILFGEKAN